MLDPNGYVMRKRRALRRARRQARQAGMLLTKFKPGPDEPKELPELFWAENKLGYGWAVVTYRPDSEWSVCIQVAEQ